MRTDRLLLVLLLTGCSDYGLNKDTRANGPLDQSEAPVDDASTLPDVEYETDREPSETVDRVVQPASFDVDVLFVVDNSCSMEDNQASLTTAFPTFIDAFLGMQGINYRIGVVSTDLDDNNHQGRLRQSGGVKWIEPDTPDPYVKFDDMARMGIDGSGDECGRGAAYHAMATHADGYNAGFFRENAAMSIIVISDEDDSSSIYGVDIDPFVDFLTDFKYDPAMMSFSAIVGPLPDGCSTAEAGRDYHEVNAAIGGLTRSICSTDWASILDELAADAAALRREFFLADIPIVNTLEVWVIESDGTRYDLERNVDYVYNVPRNSIQLSDYTPGPYAEVYIAYDVDWGASP